MKTILVPTDFSECANNAYEVAIAIAKKANASVHLLHVMGKVGGLATPDPSTGGGGGGTSATMDEVFMVKLMEVNTEHMAKLVKKADGVSVTYNIRVGDIYEETRAETKDKAADLVILGSEGADGVDEILIGSNAERIVRRSEIPVMVIKHKHEMFDIKNIVFATNAEDNTAEMIYTLKSLQEFFGATLHLLNVNTPLNFFTSRSIHKMMKEYAEKHSISNYTINIYNERTEEDGIIYFADEVNADLIAMGTHGRTGLAHFFSGSIAEDVVNHSYRPVLTLKMAK